MSAGAQMSAGAEHRDTAHSDVAHPEGDPQETDRPEADTEPADTQPAPTDHADTEPAPTDHADTEPAPTDHADTGPAPTDLADTDHATIDHPATSLRHVTDAQTIRALTHPVRLALLEALTFSGPLTATQAGALLGESATTCSFHLRQLARYGFVTEAGGGKGRTRPWRLVAVGNRVTAPEEDLEAHAAGLALRSLFRWRALERLDEWERTASLWPAEWRDADDQSNFLLWVTRAELAQVLEELGALLGRFAERLADPSARPEGAMPVEVLSFVHPVGPPPPNPPTDSALEPPGDHQPLGRRSPAAPTRGPEQPEQGPERPQQEPEQPEQGPEQPEQGPEHPQHAR